MPEPAWLEVSLIVDGELAEAVADVLARFAPNGVVIESTRIVPDIDGEGRAEGPLRVAAYLPFDDQLEETRRKLEESLWYLGRIRPLPPAEFRPVEDADWSESWKSRYRPIPIGQRLIIVPAWLDSPDPDRVEVRIDPGMAFGTGTHPTTQLCLEVIEDYLGKMLEPSIDVIDVGCGSGILSIAALKLGARHALGVDVDADAVRAARENAAVNNASDRFEIAQGSLADIQEGHFTIHHAPLVLANILAPILERLLDEGLGDLLTQDGHLVLSGILEGQADAVIAAMERNNLNLVDRRQMLDWVALVAALQP